MFGHYVLVIFQIKITKNTKKEKENRNVFLFVQIDLLFFKNDYYYFFKYIKNTEKFVLIAGRPRVYLRFNCRGFMIISSTSKSKKNSPRATPCLYNNVYADSLWERRVFPDTASSRSIARSQYIYLYTDGKWFFSSDVVAVYLPVVLNSGVLKSLFDDQN